MKKEPWYTKNFVFLMMLLYIAPVALLLLIVRWHKYPEENRKIYAISASIYSVFLILDYFSVFDAIPQQTKVISGAIVMLILFILILWYGITKKDEHP